jgi:nucleoside-diphosphate-sugar epimerase
VVLVVGGAGYVGSLLCRQLLELGHQVRVLDRMFFGEQGLEEIKSSIEVVRGDMRERDPAWLDGVESLINVGGLSNDPTAEFKPQANFEMNALAAQHLAADAAQAGVRRYLYASSCSIYDFGTQDEARDLLLDEQAAVSPTAAYAASKLEGERRLLGYAHAKFTVACLRKATLFGWSPRLRTDLVLNAMVRDALTKGSINLHHGGAMWRPLCQVADAAQAYCLLLRAPQAAINGQIFNLVWQNLRISELALAVRDALQEAGLRAELVRSRGGSVRNYRVSGRKLERTLNWQPQRGIQAAVGELVAKPPLNWSDPRLSNIEWLRLLEEASGLLGRPGDLFQTPQPAPPAPPLELKWTAGS